MRKVLTAGFLLLLTSSVDAFNERYYQDIYCSKYNGIMEFVLHDNTRVDCLILKPVPIAVEVDWAKKWADSIGQSLYYAVSTNSAAMSLLITNDVKDCKHVRKVMDVSRYLRQHGVTLYVEIIGSYNCFNELSKEK
jgi:hypothetical protein